MARAGAGTGSGAAAQHDHQRGGVARSFGVAGAMGARGLALTGGGR
jgi:hypothetical protein